jgi:hypothetical protein
MKLSEPAIYGPILLNFGAHVEKNMLNQKTQNRKCSLIFQDGQCRHLENQWNGVGRYTYKEKFAEFKIHQSGSVRPFFQDCRCSHLENQ